MRWLRAKRAWFLSAIFATAPDNRGPDLALSAPVRANRRRNGRDLVNGGLITTGPDFVDVVSPPRSDWPIGQHPPTPPVLGHKFHRFHMLRELGSLHRCPLVRLRPPPITADRIWP